ncbi:hypothetical protein AF332_08435 [Sporosarcina globispora]|uniref:Uncharacterized protein n=1 Tax=Sporosarcina globispora TaxID=1459 RepID=A0A0M0GBC4_SPOGL|nr:hypothetical protein [Sporosarcina globispora]KON86827.1 hypothetical protein AF332_08435 [Sporosarcina globispora]
MKTKKPFQLGNPEESPNSGLIRTGIAEIRKNQPESGSHLDRNSRHPQESVRIQASFGQDQRKSGRISPNPGLIRTGIAEIRKNQSEFRPYSDRNSGNPEESVRIQASF